MNQLLLNEKLLRGIAQLQTLLPKSAKLPEQSAQPNETSLATNAVSNNAQYWIFVAMLFLVPSLAQAEPWDGLADGILAIFTNGVTRTIAIVAVIGCGIAALTGKLSWQWVINITIGITLIFGSAAVVDYFVGASAA